MAASRYVGADFDRHTGPTMPASESTFGCTSNAASEINRSYSKMMPPSADRCPRITFSSSAVLSRLRRLRAS
jgi:hypothetical protein